MLRNIQLEVLSGALLAAWFAAAPAHGAVNVPKHHHHDTRDGLYIDPAFTSAAAAALSRDTNFNGTIVGNVYAQPLYLEGGSGGRAMIIAVTESNNVYALDAANGSILWQRNVGVPVPLSRLPCGDIDPLGITTGNIIQAAATYQTMLGTYVVFRGNDTDLIAFRITPANPPAITRVWTNSQNGLGSPFVTSTDGTNHVVVWGLGSEGDQRLHAFDGDTGAVIFSGGGANELMAGTRRFNTAIAAHGPIYVANDNKVYAFTVPVAPILLTNLALAGGAFQFGFTNVPGLSFTVFGTTNVTLAVTNWTRLGSVPEISPGQFQFTDMFVTTNQQRFYLVRSP